MELTNHLLISPPHASVHAYDRSLIYIIQQDDLGAAGLIINHPTHSRVSDILSFMEIEHEILEHDPIVLDGGPIDPERGFVLHTPVDYWQSTAKIADRVALTTSQDILAAIAANEPPGNYILTLGHCTWPGDRLEQEIRSNLWLTVPATREILFQTPYFERYQKALRLTGIHSTLSFCELMGNA